MRTNGITFRLIFLVGVLLLLTFFWCSIQMLRARYEFLRPGMSATEILSMFGEPIERITVEKDGQVWVYSRSWLWWSGFLRRKTQTTVSSWHEIPYRYGKITMYVDSGGRLAAWVVAGEEETVHSSLGKIEGSSLLSYFKHRTEYVEK